MLRKKEQKSRFFKINKKHHAIPGSSDRKYSKLKKMFKQKKKSNCKFLLLFIQIRAIPGDKKRSSQPNIKMNLIMFTVYFNSVF